MDINAINTLISKAFYKDQKITFGSYDENTVGVTVDRFVMYLIPEKDFIFDKKKLNRDQVDIKRLVNTSGYEDAVRTDELIQKDNKTLSVFRSGKVETFVDTKLLKIFGKNLTFKVKTTLAPVLVYENDILLGLVMPTKYKREA